MNKIQKSFYIFMLLLAHTITGQAKHIFIDVAALIDTNSMKAAQYVGVMNSLKFVSHVGHKPEKADLFQSLMDIPSESTHQTYNENIAMPTIFSDWLLGLSTNNVIQEKINNFLTTSSMSDIEKKVYRNIIDMMFCPEKLASTHYIVKAVRSTIIKLKQSGYTVYLVGNVDPASESLLINKLNENGVGSYIDHYVFSHNIKKLKPSADFFQHIFDTYKISPGNCISIEIESYFIQAAQDAKVHVVNCDHYHEKQLHHNLQIAGISL